jgi:DNA-3-methyladenine glycosylase I
VFEIGLSWSIVFGKRDAFRRAFRSFDVAKVAVMTARGVDRLVQDASIIHNRGKIQATVDKVRAMMSASPSLAALAKSYEVTRKGTALRGRPATSTPQVEAFATHLKSQGTASWAEERLRVHAERRRGQRPRPRVLPRYGLPRHGPEPLTIAVRPV